MGNEVYTRQQYWGQYEDKEAEVGGEMPNSVRPDEKPDKGAKSVIPKTGSAVGLPEGVQAEAVKGEQAEKHPQAKPLSPRVNVSGKEPPKLITEKKAEHFAMPSLQRYPIDNLGQVKQASAYFDEHWQQFAPRHRREYCQNLVKRASVLGIPVSEQVHAYGGQGYAPHAELEVAIASRRSVLLDEDLIGLLDKVAEARVGLSPDEFAQVLGEFDKAAGLDEHYDGEVPDPYRFIFGKVAEDNSNESFVIGNDIVYAEQLKLLAASPCRTLQDRFGSDFVKEFKKDPVAIFRSLPTDQKKILAREAAEPTLSN